MSNRLFPDNRAPTGQSRSAKEARDVAVSPLDTLKTPIQREAFTNSVQHVQNKN